MQLKQKPYNLLLLAGLLVCIISFFTHNSNSTIDLRFHDSYLIIENIYIFWLLAFIILILWTIYFLSKRILFSVILTWIHVISTVVTIFIMFFPLNRRYFEYTDWETFYSYDLINSLFEINIFTFFIGQMLFVTHLIWGLIRLISSPIKK